MSAENALQQAIDAAREALADYDKLPITSPHNGVFGMVCATALGDLLAALDAEPAQVVPDEMPAPIVGAVRTEYTDGYCEGWNNCRAAMLAAQESTP